MFKGRGGVRTSGSLRIPSLGSLRGKLKGTLGETPSPPGSRILLSNPGLSLGYPELGAMGFCGFVDCSFALAFFGWLAKPSLKLSWLVVYPPVN